MMKSYFRKRKIKNACIAALCCVTVTCTGLAAACTTTSEDKDPVTYPKGEDTQLLKNGNFEYFSIPDDAKYLIKTPDSWSRSGDSSAAMSGVISTSAKGWSDLTDPDLADKLDANNELDSDDEDYKDKYINYNGMKSGDLLYRDTYSATLAADDVADSYIKNQGYRDYFGIEERDGKYYLTNGVNYLTGDAEVYFNDADDPDFYLDKDLTVPVRKNMIGNPETHYDVAYDENGVPLYFTNEDGERVNLYVDETTGDYFYLADGVESVEKADEDDKIFISNVLMVHNADSKHNGISQHYGASTTITLKANTAAEISLWVKTSDLRFDKGYSQLNDEGRGAYIEVVQTVSGTTVDSFKITAINTEKILANNSLVKNSNGWLQYTVYVNACDFADSTVTLNLGLGGDTKTENVSGYAFFDDVSVTEYTDLSDEKCSYGSLTAADNLAVCTLTSKEEDKIFIADKEVRSGNDLRYSENFYYLIDLASETLNNDSNVYQSVKLGNANVTAGLTTEEVGIKTYVSSTENRAKYTGVNQTVTDAGTTLRLPSGMNGDSRPTANDLIGVYDFGKTFAASDFNGTDYSFRLNGSLQYENGNFLPKFKDATNNNMLIMLSAYGAAYTATVSDNAFTLGADEYVILSFWIKTSDMNGKTAATLKAYDADDEDVSTSFSLDSTDITTTDVADQEDIYDGWVQCFFFVHNDTEESRAFKVDFSFGNTSLSETTAPSYNYGWVALANMQYLKIDDTVFGMVSDNDYSVKLTLTNDESKSNGKVFDEASGTSNIKSGIAVPSTYEGVNGGSSAVAGKDYRENYDGKNTNAFAGLINKDHFENYDGEVQRKILTSFMAGATSWSQVFGNQCYQPLIIVNNLRTYADAATATAETYKNYYVLAEDNYDGQVMTVNGKTYRPVGDEAFDENQTYYSFNQVVNYGYIGASSTLSADSYTTVSVKVMVSAGATAYIYLVDTETREVLGYSTPEVTFWYDDDGNVLDEEYDDGWTDREHRQHIIYTLRDDGLYEKDGKLYANLYNLTKVYNDPQFEHDTFYDASGNPVSFDDLTEGKDYWTDANKTTVAEHFLCASDGTRVYEYFEGNYYYLIKKTTTNAEGEEVTNKVKGENVIQAFDKKYARNTDKITADRAPYTAVVGDTNGKWVTVNFLIHTGSESKNYRLELWSGERNSAGETETAASGAVAFDTSSYSVSESNYASLLSEYEQTIIGKYNKILSDEGLIGEVASNSENIAYYETLFVTLNDRLSAAAKDKIAEIRKDYAAMYYTYTLYDAENYVPFNADTAADGETGYVYTQSEYSETLAYFTYTINDEDGNLSSYNVFADYSAVDKNIEVGTKDDDDTKDDEEEVSYEVWLLISSIILVVVLLITLLSILIRDIVKRIRLKKGVKLQSKNAYKKRERYIKRLHLVRNEDAVETPDEAKSQATEESASAPSTEEADTPSQETEIPNDEPEDQQ